MRYPASEKLEIIQLVEQSHLPVRPPLEQIVIPRSTFYRWHGLYRTGGPEALDDRCPRPDRVSTNTHDVERVIVVLRGHLTVFLEDQKGRTEVRTVRGNIFPVCPELLTHTLMMA